MSTSSRFFSLPVSFSCLAAVVALAVVGCGGRSEEPSSHSSETNASQGAASNGPAKPSPTAAKECSGKACGVDCTPAGSDEPFNCNSAGQCVATGQALGCKACPEFLGDCIMGEEPADFDGDGCRDGCKPKSCPPFLGDCRQGDEPADLDGDGCTDGCKPVGSK